jgi:hypothetical protein
VSINERHYRIESGGFDWKSAGQTLMELDSTGVKAKLPNHLISVHDFGAVGDGVMDDTAAWTAAIAAVSSGTIVGKPGATYLLQSGIAIASKTDVHLVGNGSKLKIGAAATQTNLVNAKVKFLSSTRCSISGFEMDGNGRAADFVSLNTCTDCVVEKNRAYNCSAVVVGGVFTDYGGTRTVFRDNLIYDSLGHGIRAGNYSAAQMGTDYLIAGNTIRDGAFDGIVCSSVGGRIEGNRCVGNGASGIIFGGANGLSSKRLCIVGNSCESNDFFGIQSDVSYSTTADLPVSVTITGNVCASNLSGGIYAPYGAGTSIGDNICQDNVGPGILVDDQREFTIVGNVCKDTRSGGSRTQTIGIRLVSDIGNIGILNGAVAGNSCFNNTEHGIAIQSVGATDVITNLAVSGNIACNNGTGGIFITEGTAGTVTGLSVTGNVCKSNGTTNLRTDPTDIVEAGNNT